MSYLHVDLAVPLEIPHATGKAVLLVLAWHACGACGVAWPGAPLIGRRTGLGATAVKAALHWLVGQGHLEIRAYAQGGRGRATEYIVLPGLLELSTAPCGECQRRMKRSREATGIEQNQSSGDLYKVQRGREAASNNENQSPNGSETSRVATPNKSVTITSHTRTPRVPHGDAGGEPTGDVEASSPLSRAENAARALELARAIGAGMTLPKP